MVTKYPSDMCVSVLLILISNQLCSQIEQFRLGVRSYLDPIVDPMVDPIKNLFKTEEVEDHVSRTLLINIISSTAITIIIKT